MRWSHGIEIERTQVPFLNDVFVAVAVVVP